MAGWRQAMELGLSDEAVTALATISRSRTEPASRVERARILLAYRDNPSFFAVGQAMGLHHQTVQRCIERAVAYGPIAALDDRARPGRAPTITAEAKAWVVNLACRKPKELGYPHELWTTRLLARHARELGPTEGHDCLGKLAQGTLCKILKQQEIKPHKVRYYLEHRDPEFKAKMAEIRALPPGEAHQGNGGGSQTKAQRGGGDRLLRREACIQALASTAPTCHPNPGYIRLLPAIMSTSARVRSVCWRVLICSPARFTPSSRTATAVANSLNSSKFSMLLIRLILRSS